MYGILNMKYKCYIAMVGTWNVSSFLKNLNTSEGSFNFLYTVLHNFIISFIFFRDINYKQALLPYVHVVEYNVYVLCYVCSRN